MKISGALKKTIKKILAGFKVTKETNPQNFEKAIAKIKQREKP